MGFLDSLKTGISNVEQGFQTGYQSAGNLLAHVSNSVSGFGQNVQELGQQFRSPWELPSNPPPDDGFQSLATRSDVQYYPQTVSQTAAPLPVGESNEPGFWTPLNIGIAAAAGLTLILLLRK